MKLEAPVLKMPLPPLKKKTGYLGSRHLYFILLCMLILQTIGQAYAQTDTLNILFKKFYFLVI